jgi:hypothetical protein
MDALAEKVNGTERLDLPAMDAGKAITLQRLRRQTIVVPIVGITPLIPQKWSEKALRMMREAQGIGGTKVRRKHDAKNPEEEANAATYWLEDGRAGMPATGFKAAMVYACRFFDSRVFPMTKAKVALFVVGEGPEQLVPIVGESTIREDTPRNANGVADLRYRRSFWPWRADLTITFVESELDASSVVALVDAAGMGGIGSWRPSAPKSATGTYGQWRVDEDVDVSSVS